MSYLRNSPNNNLDKALNPVRTCSCCGAIAHTVLEEVKLFGITKIKRTMCKACYAKSQLLKRALFKAKLIKIAGGECVDCGEKRVSLLDLHHIHPLNGRERAIYGSCDHLEQIKRGNIIVLCSNCHRLRHNNELEGIEIKDWYLQYVYERVPERTSAFKLSLNKTKIKPSSNAFTVSPNHFEMILKDYLHTDNVTSGGE